MRLLMENVRVRAADGESERTLLAVDRFTLASGERLGLRGASGSGKTTFLKAISGILRAEGSVLWDDTDLSRLSEAERDAWRGANVGFLFQDFRLFDGLNALENVLLPVTFTRSITDADRWRGGELLARFGVRPQTEASRNAADGPRAGASAVPRRDPRRRTDGESRQTQRARRDDGAYGSRRGTPKHPHRRDARPGNARDAPARRLD